MSAEFVAVQVDPDTYGRSGDIIKHVEGVKKQYDTKEKLEFYAQVMGDGTDNIHFGKWGGVDSSQPGAYGRASEQMSDWMFALGRELVPHRTHATDFTYVDLGSGTGAAAIRLTEMHPFISKVSCLNLCDEQNDLARKRAADLHLGERIDVLTGTYEEAPFSENQFDLSFSQDAFVHANLRIGFGKSDDLQVLNKDFMLFFRVHIFRGEGIRQGDLGAFNVVEFGIQLSQFQLHNAVGRVGYGEGLLLCQKPR